MPSITLEQWLAVVNVVDAGGYAQAAQSMHKSQSAITYAIQKIEAQLGVKLFEIQGRKATLTPTGSMLYRRALALLEDARNTEKAANALSAGWEAEITIAAEILFPYDILLSCLQRFGQESPHTRIEIIESVLGGTSDILLNGAADLVISPYLPPGVFGELLTRIRLIAVAHRDHPLQHYARELTQQDLREHRHFVVRDSGVRRNQSALSIDVDQRWTVTHIQTSIKAVLMGYGFAWLPEAHIREELAQGHLKPLALREGGVREVPLYLVFANPDFVGPGVRFLASILKAAVAELS